STVTLSPSEADFTGMVYIVRHAVFMGGALSEMGSAEGNIPWSCDNHGAIRAASKAGCRGRTKQVGIKVENTRKYIENGTMV
ncbi:unnamed protein product, partial [Sphacelaria rigidula]